MQEAQALTTMLVVSLAPVHAIVNTDAASFAQSATNGGQESACKECRVRNRKYRDTKKRRRGIVGEILRSFPDALAMRNGFGLSPFLYHQLTRENTVGKLQSNGTPDLATQKEPPPTPTAVEEPRSGKVRRVPTHLVWGADSGSESVDKQPKNPKGLDKQKPKMTAPGPSSNGTTMLAPDSPHPSKKRSSGSRECHDPGTWHHLSNETMKLLIEKSFSLGGRYRDACHCLFQDRNLVTDGECHRVGLLEGFVVDQHLDQGHGRRDSWEPPRRITPQTIKSYDFLKFEPMMALLRIRLTPDPWATTPPTSDRSWEVMTRDDEDALEAFFTWLKGPKGVTTILKLVVMENQDRPCSERVVRECLKGLDVRYLDWKRRDICVDTLLVVPNIVELWLYSSGLNAVLCGWSDEHGLGRFTKVGSTLQRHSRGIGLELSFSHPNPRLK